MGETSFTQYGLEDLILNGINGRTFYLQAGTSVPTGGKEGGTIGSRVTATKTLTPSGKILVRFEGLHTATTDRTIRSMGYVETYLELLSGQQGRLKATINRLGV